MFFHQIQVKKTILWYFIVFILLLGINCESFKQFYEHRYFTYEQDAYMHLVIAQDFIAHPNLYNHFNSRINTPWGADTHGWTNLVTLLLVGGAFLLKPFFTLHKALYLWAFFLPILANALALWAIVWAIKPLKPSFYQKIFIVLAFLINPFLHSYFLPLQVDYDFLLITLSIAYWGFFLRVLTTESCKKSILSGLTACLGLWTSISFILPLLFSLGFLFYQNLNDKIKNITIYTLLASLIIFLIPIICLEQNPFFSQCFDTISIVHLSFFSMILVLYTLYQLLSPSSLFLKTTLIIILSLILFYLMNCLFPGFYLGPYNHVSAFVLKHLFPNVSEFHSPFAINNALALALLCYFFIGAGYFYFLALTEGLSSPYIFLLCSAVFMTVLTAYMYRWCIYSLPLNIWLISFWIKDFEPNKPLWKFFIFILSLCSPNLILILAKGYANPQQQHCEDQLHEMLIQKFFDQSQFTHDKSLLIHSNYGPLILYSSHFSIVASNDHHNPNGVKDSFYFFKGREEQAKNIVDKRHINLLLLCPKGYSLGFNPQTSNWLKPVPLPSKYSAWQLYRTSN